jgi:hypothetical protein
MKQILLAIALIVLISGSAFSGSTLWQDVQPGSFNLKGTVYLAPTSFRTVLLNKFEMASILNSAPDESQVRAQYSNVIISLPMPNGTMGRFSVVESSVMEADLQAKFPEIRTYVAQGIDDIYATARLDYTPAGFHAMVRSPFGTVFIDPFSMNESDYYMSYYKHDYRPAISQPEFICHTETDNRVPVYTPSFLRTGEQLRTYRLAVACTQEFTSVCGGTKLLALANVITTTNRITGVYEQDFAVRLSVINNDTAVIYLPGGPPDPYTNNNGNALLSENQANLDAVIGDANYDIGHVFSTGNFGGIAFLACVCASGTKGRGATGSTNPIGDPWSIDYVAHEMGHQFGGNHTQNNLNCNANPGTAWEPGSGITIMGYAGVCAPNLANNSIAYMHGGNIFVELIPNTQAGTASTCPVVTSTGNSAPVVTVPAGGFSIPISTPFYLTGSATDTNNDPLTYSWEQTNTGPQGHPNNPVGNAPIFRPFPPVTTGTRIFPRLSSIINNTQTLGELLPTYERLMRFRLTVRDNRAGGGGIGSEEIVYLVAGTAGPFLVTFPNTNVSISGDQTVTWDVANTNTAPVSCANVKISLSTDGGNTFPTVLSASTPNDGSQLVTLPSISTSQARIKIEAADNIFFDMSNANFTINPIGINNNQNGTPIEFGLEQNYPNPFNPVTILSYAIPKKSAVTLKVYDAIGREIATLVNNEIKTEGYYNIEFDASRMPSGIYYYRLVAGAFSDTKKMILVK